MSKNKSMSEDEKWMKLAINQAKLAAMKGEIPVGAILVKNGKLLASAHNQPRLTNDATAHAEINLIRQAGKSQGNYRLIGTSLYVTLEPCSMCLGAIVHARVDRLIFGAFDSKSGVCGSAANLALESFHNHKIKIKGGILQEECGLILKDFFKKLRV